MKKLLETALLSSALIASICSGCSGSASDTSSQTQGYSWTGQRTLELAPLSDDIPYSQIVNITDPDLTVRADIDFSKGGNQTVPFEVINRDNGTVYSTEDITVNIQTALDPEVDVHFPSESAIPAKDFQFAEFVSVSGKYEEDGSDYDLSQIAPNEFFSGTPGYLLYDAASGRLLPSDQWEPGQYDLILVASNGYGNSVVKDNIRFILN